MHLNLNCMARIAFGSLLLQRTPYTWLERCENRTRRVGARLLAYSNEPAGKIFADNKSKISST